MQRLKFSLACRPSRLQVHQSIVQLLLAMLSPQLAGGGAHRRGGALGPRHLSPAESALVTAVLGTGAAQTALLPALMAAYSHADHVVGLDVDKDQVGGGGVGGWGARRAAAACEAANWAPAGSGVGHVDVGGVGGAFALRQNSQLVGLGMRQGRAGVVSSVAGVVLLQQAVRRLPRPEGGALCFGCQLPCRQAAVCMHRAVAAWLQVLPAANTETGPPNPPFSAAVRQVPPARLH